MLENPCNDVNKIEEISFYKHNTQVTPEELFSDIYSPLGEIISSNVQKEMTRKKDPYARFTIFNEKDLELINSSKNQIRQKSLQYLCKIGYKSGKKINYNIDPRTNYGLLLKQPNIVYLSRKGVPPMILREGVDRENEPIFTRTARKKFKNKYKGKINEESNPKFSEVYFIPEPKLLLGLEEIYSRNIVNKITPTIRAVDSKNNNLWYIRNFFPSVRDSSVEESQIGDYHGRLNGLGLIDVLDNQMEHYCVQSKKMIHIDPDYICYSINPNFGNQTDLKEMKNMFPGVFSNLYGNDVAMKRRQEKILSIQKKMGDKKFHEYVPKNVTDSPSYEDLKIKGY